MILKLTRSIFVPIFRIVEANLIKALARQKSSYDKQKRQSGQIKNGNSVWLSISKAGKLNPKWETQSHVTMEIMGEIRSRMVNLIILFIILFLLFIYDCVVSIVWLLHLTLLTMHYLI